MSRIMTNAVFVFMCAGILAAQDELPMRGPGAQRLEQYKKIRLLEVLKLDEETSIKFFSRYEKQQEGLRRLNATRNELIDELQRLHRRDAGDKEYQKILLELKNLAKPATEIRGQFFEDISEILTPKQVAEYFVFERNFLQNVREIMREMQQNRMRGRPR